MIVSETSRPNARTLSGAASDPRPHRLAQSLRIALIRQRWRPDGGAERQVNAFLEVLDSQPCDVTLVTRSWSASSNHHVLPCNPFSIGRVWREWGFARGVQRILARHDFDLVQSHERIAGCDVYRAGDGVHREWLRQKGRLQSVLQRAVTAISPYHAYVKRAERQVFESPDLQAVICNSRMVRDEILHWFQTEPHKLHVVYNGVDTDRFHPRLSQFRTEMRRRLNVPAEATLFAFVGSGFDRKGLAVAVEAVARTPHAYLVVVGKDKNAARYCRQAERLGIADRLRMEGVHHDVGPYYGAADALLLPTLYDPFPNVVLEALAAGLPVVTSTKCGAAELIAEGENGFVRDALDRNGLCEAMRKLAEPGRRAAMSRAARAAVEPLNLDATRRRLLQLYTELLDDRNR